MQTPNEITAVLERMLPVGSIVEWSPVDGDGTDLSTPEKVAAYYGFGKWESYGTGRFLLGISESHAVGSTGGEERHTLTTSEIPAHTHTIRWGYGAGPRDSTRVRVDTNSPESDWAGTGSAGGGQSHNNMPPYITVYRWRRIK